MLIPLVRAGGRLDRWPAARSRNCFAGHGVEEFFRESLTFAKASTILEDMHHVPLDWSCMPPTVMMVLGLRRRLAVLHPPSRDLPVELARQHRAAVPLPAQQVVLRRALRLHLRAAGQVARPLSCGRSGDGWLIDGFGPDGVSARVLDVTRNVVRLQTGYLYHYAFAMLIGVAALDHLVHVRGGSALMTSWPILSVIDLPAAASARCSSCMLRGDDEPCERNARWVALWTTLVTFAVSLILVWRFDPLDAGLPVRREGALARRRDQLSRWASTASRCRSSS